MLKRADDPTVKAAAAAVLGVTEGDPGGKAPHGDSSDDEDELLAEKLKQASGQVKLACREASFL